MGLMRRVIMAAVILVLAGLSVSRTAAAPRPKPQEKAGKGQGDVERGRYLVEEVARCPECHTPRDANGEP